MSTLKTLNVQLGQSLTATNNFTWYQPLTPDGTVRLGVGNSGATSSDVISVDNSGNCTHLGNLTVSGTGAATFGGNIVASGTGTSTFGGNITTGGTATSTFGGDIVVNGTGTSTIAGDLTVTGNIVSQGSTPVVRIVQGTVQTLTGSAVGFTGLPTWVKRITIQVMSAVQLSGGYNIGIQIGSGSYLTSGYVGGASWATGAAANASALISNYFTASPNISSAVSGAVVLTLANPSTNTWVASGGLGADGISYYDAVTTGKASLAGALDRVQVYTTGSGFSSGSVNIMYEG